MIIPKPNAKTLEDVARLAEGNKERGGDGNMIIKSSEKIDSLQGRAYRGQLTRKARQGQHRILRASAVRRRVRSTWVGEKVCKG